MPGKSILTGEGRETVSIRKIENGWIITRTIEGKDDFKSTETFTEEKPDLVIK